MMKQYVRFRRFSAGVVGALGLCLGSVAWAQASDGAARGYPEQPIRLLIGQAPGGAVETVARWLAERLGEALGQNVVVESRSGAGGMIAAGAVARAAPDGYQLGLFDVGALVVSPILQESVDYDLEDFDYLGTVALVPLVMVANPSVSFSDPAQVAQAAREQPEAYTYGSAGVGSPPHLAFAAFLQASGAPITHVPYRGGAPALMAVVAGDVHYTFIDINLANQYAQSERVKPIAISTLQRHVAMPDLPTFDESGLEGFEFTPWLGLAGPAGLPANVVERLNDALRVVLEESGRSRA